jgi:hypothetical protein
MSIFPRDTPLSNNPVDRAVALLQALPQESREKVLSHMDEEHRALIEEKLTKLRPHQEFTDSVTRGRHMAEQRKLMRTAIMGIHKRETERVQQANEYSHGGGTPGAAEDAQAPIDALDHLRDIHPAALAKAMQGERAEAWALVLRRLSPTSRDVLMSFIDEPARVAIHHAEQEQQQLPESLRRTAERALRHTVVPRALREQQLLMQAPLSTMRPTGTL